MARTKEFADQHRRYSRVAAFYWEGAASEVEATLKGNPPQVVAAVVQAFGAGIKEEGHGQQDKADQFEMAKRLARMYAKGDLPGGKNLDTAFQTMEMAARFAREAGLSPRVRAETLIEAAGFRKDASEAPGLAANQRAQFLEDFARLTREALPVDPENDFAWYWKMRVAAVVTPRVEAVRAAKPPDQAVREARMLEETARYYREADDAMPLRFRAQFPWLGKERSAVEKLLPEALGKALAAAPNDPEAWMWQWALAEHYAANGSADLAEARKYVAAAAKAMPATTPPQFKTRVAQLRKELDERK
jgi:hypothetical protein